MTPELAVLFHFCIARDGVEHIRDCWICRTPAEQLGPAVAAALGLDAVCPVLQRIIKRRAKAFQILHYYSPALAERALISLTILGGRRQP